MKSLVWLSRIAFVVAAGLLLHQGLELRKEIRGDGKFVFAGSDSYGYVKLANELIEHHRYALGPPPAKLHWARPPGFPLYLVLVKGRQIAEATQGDGWVTIAKANARLEVFGTGLLVSLAAFAIGGLGPALIALLLMMFGPWNALATPAALTETLASFLVTGAIAMLIPPSMGSRRIGWLVAAGAFYAAATLTRPDSLLIAPAFAFAIHGCARARQAAVDWRGRLRSILAPAAAAIVAFAVVFAPWPIRNLVQLGKAHPLGGRIDRWSEPVERYEGSWAYLRAISKDWRPMTWTTTCYYDLKCQPTLQMFLEANDTIVGDERAELARLIDLRVKQGHTQAVSDGFMRLAHKRLRAHPFEVEVAFPAMRLKAMWISTHDELVPYYAPKHTWTWKMKRWSKMLMWAAIVAGFFMLLHRPTRLAGLVLAAATIGRTAIMAYAFYSMPRYLLESVPSTFVLIAGGLFALGALLAESLRRAASSTKSTSGVESASTNT